MAAVTTEPAQQDRLPGAGEADPAVQRVTAYLLNLGLPTEHASEWARRMVREVRANESAVDDSEGVGRAVDGVTDRVDEWLRRLAESCPEPGDDLSAQLKWHLQPALQRHPESFLQTQDLPDDVQQAIREAARPILPPLLPAVMPAQSFGHLPRLGHRIVARSSVIRRRFVNLLWRVER